jgi:hypothetical protein
VNKDKKIVLYINVILLLLNHLRLLEVAHHNESLSMMTTITQKIIPFHFMKLLEELIVTEFY